MGVGTDEVFATFPHLALRENRIVVDPVAVSLLVDDHRSRLNQYRWEGAFFLLVLFVGMGVMSRTIQAEAALRRRQRDFVQAVTHELKSPLASLQLAKESMARRQLDEAGKNRWLGRMDTDLRRLGSMVSNILDVTRLDHGEIELRPTTVPLADAVARVERQLHERADESSVTFHLTVPEELAAHADPVGIEVVLRNVMQNALHATAGDGGQVTVSGRQDGDEAVLTVEDNGIGFPPEEARNIFKRFYRVGDEMVRRTPGSGLGLSITRHYLAIANGRIEAHSEGTGKGATFTIRWPADKGIA